MDTKICTCCKIKKTKDNFHKRKRCLDGLNYYCKSCVASFDLSRDRDKKTAYDKIRYHTGKDNYRNYYYQREYGITLEHYNSLLKEQNNVCAICKSICPTGKRLAVDHCHTSRKVRGLLCGPCNKALGMFQDNTERLSTAINYLKGKYATS